ncbi:MAG: hypothetical protein ACK5VI_10850 [Opitutia bacterium]|jgi:hypothetical protein
MRFITRWLNSDATGGGGPAAPAPTIDAVPPSPIQAAIAAAREQLQTSGTLTPPAAPEQPRAANGQFAPPAAPDAVAAVPEAQPEAAPEDAQPEAAPETTEAGEAEENPLLVELPGRRPEDPPFAVEAKTPEEAERLRQLVNGYQRGAELQRAEAMIQRDREAIAMIESRLEVDPEGFMFDNIPKERAASVALQVLLEPDVWSEAKDVLEELLASDEKRDLVRVSLENQRLKNKDTAQQQIELRQQAARNANEIRQVCAMLVPESLPEDQQLALYKALQEEVSAHAERLNLPLMDPRDVPLVVASRLRQYGLDPVSAAARLTDRTSRPPQPSGRPGAAPAMRPAAPAKPTAQQFAAAAKAAKQASAVLPAGNGLPSAAAVPAPPKGQTIEQRLEWAKQNLKFG